VYSYKTIDLDEINAMLNGEDVSEYLKLSSDGLEVSDTFTLLCSAYLCGKLPCALVMSLCLSVLNVVTFSCIDLSRVML